MIPRELLVAKGSIEALLTLADGSSFKTNEMADEMGVSTGTARGRLGDLGNEGLVEVDADIENGRPVRVYKATDEGRKLATSLAAIVDEASGGPDEVGQDEAESEA